MERRCSELGLARWAGEARRTRHSRSARSHYHTGTPVVQRAPGQLVRAGNGECLSLKDCSSAGMSTSVPRDFATTGSSRVSEAKGG